MLELEIAERIIQNYNEILTKTITLFIPESLLPYSKEQIKDAMKVCLLVHNTDENFQYQCDLTTSYVSLSNFISDEKAVISDRVYNNIEKSKSNSDEDLQVYREVQREMYKEWKKLYFEIVEYLSPKYRNKILEIINRKDEEDIMESKSF